MLLKTLSKKLTFFISLACCLLSIQFSIVFAQNLSDEANRNQQSVLHAHDANGDYEPALLLIIDSIQKGQLSRAVDLSNQHLQEFPKSQVGHFLKAEALMAMTTSVKGVGQRSVISADNFEGLKHQIKNRWRHASKHKDITHFKFPSSLLDIGDHPYVIVADLPEGRLYLYENYNGEPKLVRDYYMTVGSSGYGKTVEGDNKTPIGVYQINRYIEGSALPDLYGKGAFPVNYPNRYDRFLKRTGYGIWLHGTPSDTYARSPFASEGCFVLSNDDLLDIGQFVSAKNKTPVILSDEIEWLSMSELQQKRASMLKVINQWKSDWESLDTDRYTAHYQESSFNLGVGDYSSWKQRKKSINENKTFVQVDIDLQSLFAYPGEKDMFIAIFKQRYLSDNYSGESIKEQFWKRDDQGQWRIVFEG